MIFGIAIVSATDVGVTLAENSGNILSQFLLLPSGSCRMSKLHKTDHWYTEIYAFYKDGLGAGLDKKISSIYPNNGVICSLYEWVHLFL